MTSSLFTSIVGASGVFPVLLDTCALFGPLLRDVLLEAAWNGMYRPHWSNGILAELERNLRRKGWDDGRINHLGVALRKAFPEAMVDVPLGFEQCLTCDHQRQACPCSCDCRGMPCHRHPEHEGFPQVVYRAVWNQSGKSWHIPAGSLSSRSTSDGRLFKAN